MPTMTNNTVNISQLMEKICRKLKPVCTAMVAKRMFFLPNLQNRAQNMAHAAAAAVTQGTWRAPSHTSWQTLFCFQGWNRLFSLSHPPQFFLGDISGVHLPRRCLLRF